MSSTYGSSWTFGAVRTNPNPYLETQVYDSVFKGFANEFQGKQTFSGSDIAVVFTIPITSFTASESSRHWKASTEIQTITISSTMSILPVRRCGEARPMAFCRGARTFAGSMVFTIMDNDPFKELFSVDMLNASTANDGAWHVDQLPPFDIIILAQNETGGIGVQIIHNVRIVHWGTTFSVDDMFTEATYTYVAEHVTPFLVSTNPDFLPESAFNGQRDQTPDDIIDHTVKPNGWEATTDFLRSDAYQDLIRYGLVPGNVYQYRANGMRSSDPNYPGDQ